MSATTNQGSLGTDDSSDAYTKMREWQHVWLRAIALAWHDADFKCLLLEDARTAFAKYLEYDLPTTLELTIFEVDSDDVEWNDQGNVDWHELPPNRLQMPLPPAPKLEDQAIAIADYADAGRTYPFTCCC